MLTDCEFVYFNFGIALVLASRRLNEPLIPLTFTCKTTVMKGKKKAYFSLCVVLLSRKAGAQRSLPESQMILMQAQDCSVKAALPIHGEIDETTSSQKLKAEGLTFV